MSKINVKSSFLDHVKDASYSFTFFIFIVLSLVITHVLKVNKFYGLLNFSYYVIFFGFFTILFLAYIKRYNEIKFKVTEPIKWSWISISLVVYLFLLLFFEFLNFNDVNIIDKIYTYINNDNLTTFYLLFPAFILLMLLFFKRKNDDYNLTGKDSEPGKLMFLLKVVLSIAIFVFPILSIYTILFATEFEKDFPYTAIILCIILFFIIVAMLMIVFNITKGMLFTSNKLNTGYNKLNFYNLIKYTFLYIPCLITELIDFIKHEYKITTNTSLAVLGSTSLIVIMYFLVPAIRKYLYNFGSTQLLEGPIYLNNYKKLGRFEMLDDKLADKNKSTEFQLLDYKLKLDFKQVDDFNFFKEDSFINKYLLDKTVIDSSNNILEMYNYNYSVTFWVNINPQPPSTGTAYNEFTSIFSFGKKPEILYKASNNHLMVKMAESIDGESIIYKSKTNTDMKLQKWNHFCLNYNKGTLDVFLNNHLIATKHEIVPYVSTDAISCGSAGGIEGGICNIRYYNRVLSKSQIYTEYESFKDKNPPII